MYWSNIVVETTDIEKKSLEAHVELCAERYKALELQLTDVKQDVNALKTLVQQTHAMVHSLTDKRNNQLISWGIGIIGTLLAAVGWLASHYIKTL